MAPTPTAHSATTIVLKGQFTPALFSPAWLLAQGLIGVQEYDDVKLNFINTEIASFATGWLDFYASADTLQFSTSDDSEIERLRDIAIGILQVLPHTPLVALGINRHFHSLCRSVAEWHAIGDLLAPKAPWADIVSVPGMTNVTILGQRDSKFAGRIQVQVEPSYTVMPGIFLTVNDHYDLGGGENKIETREDVETALRIDMTTASRNLSDKNVPIALAVLNEEWAASISRSSRIRDRVGELGNPS